MFSRIGGRRKSWSTMSSNIGVLADDSGSFRNRDGYKIACTTWSPEVQPRALVFLAHGYAEHCHVPCYDSLARTLVELGCYVFAHDHVGHGKSEGPRGTVKSADIYVDDILTHVDLVRQKFPGRPVFLFGHSMGGLLVAMAAERRPKDIAGLIMMAPLLAVDKEQGTWLKMTLARILGRVVPNLPIGDLDLSLVSRDPETVAWMTNDPLRYHGSVRMGWAAAILNALEDLQAKIDLVDIPFLIQHGSGDKLCDLGGSEDFYKKAPSKDKSMKVYKECYHSLLTEPGEMGQQVLKDIADWYTARFPS
uniref:Putative lysophospholipase n=2 Tax=Amblyomma TaxID=6942 RepID=A0A023G7K1_AMBTT